MMSNNQSGRILIVDDDPINIEILKIVLENEHDILCADNGAQAFELAKKYQPDLILLDVIMPVMDGFELCRLLKTHTETSAIPVIFITGLNDTEAEIQGLQVGAIDYVTKPINPPIVQMRVRNHIELQRARNHLKCLAITDGLTELANRRHFDEVLQNELNRQARLHHPLSLIMLDVDFFKRFNDNYGHVIGDNCLKKIAQTLKNSLHRTTDFVARYGGEEFVCILPNIGQADAVMIAERIRTNIENLNIPHQCSSAANYVTASLGVFTVPALCRISPCELISQADAQLYRAKENGRNQICFSQLSANEG
jgi:diguanylate cyclase (GGDEF)-like protein